MAIQPMIIRCILKIEIEALKAERLKDGISRLNRINEKLDKLDV